MANRIVASNRLDACFSVPCRPASTMSSWTVRTGAGPNASALPTATYTRRFDERSVATAGPSHFSRHAALRTVIGGQFIQGGGHDSTPHHEGHHRYGHERKCNCDCEHSPTRTQQVSAE